jgi:sugar phosphate permease
MGLRFGQAFATLVTPVLCVHLGWRYVFQLFGVFSIVVALMWLSFGTAEPAPVDDLNALSIIEDDEEDLTKASLGFWETVIPLRALRHPATLVVIFIHCSCNSAQYTLMSWGPTYCTDVLKMPLEIVGPALTVPVVATGMGVLASGFLMDRMSRSGMSLLATRRWVLVASLVVSGIILAPFGYIRSIPLASVLIFIVFLALGAVDTAMMSNYVDIAPSNTASVVALGIP